VLTGASPGGIERELRRTGERERPIRPAFAAVLGLVGVVGLWLDPVIVLWLAGLFGEAMLLQRSDTHG
jgi:hypothetical protein